jgi:hypothetical protein
MLERYLNPPPISFAVEIIRCYAKPSEGEETFGRGSNIVDLLISLACPVLL